MRTNHGEFVAGQTFKCVRATEIQVGDKIVFPDKEFAWADAYEVTDRRDTPQQVFLTYKTTVNGKLMNIESEKRLHKNDVILIWQEAA